jgi:hypothetical protein
MITVMQFVTVLGQQVLTTATRLARMLSQATGERRLPWIADQVADRAHRGGGPTTTSIGTPSR